MHEFSIASQIWQSVSAAARRRGGRRVRSISLEVGEMNLLEDEQLRFWVGALAERDGSPGVEVKIAHLPARVRCEECGAEGAPLLPGGDIGHLVPPSPSCSECGSRRVKITGGRELRVVSAEIDVEDSDGSRE